MLPPELEEAIKIYAPFLVVGGIKYNVVLFGRDILAFSRTLDS